MSHPSEELHRALAVQLCVTVVLLAYAVACHLTVTPRHTQFFTERDPSLSYPDVPSTVPNAVLAVTSALVPAVAVIAANLLRRRATRRACVKELRGIAGGGGDATTPSASASTEDDDARSNARAHADANANADAVADAVADADADARPGTTTRAALYLCCFELLGLAQAIFLTMGSYNAVKSFVGRLRPNFFAACDYKGYGEGLASGNLSAYMAATEAGAVGDAAHCRASADDVHEASLSFPSGHAAMSFAGMTYAAWALASMPFAVGELGAAAAAARWGPPDVYRVHTDVWCPRLSAAAAAAAASRRRMLEKVFGGVAPTQPRGVSPWLAVACLPLVRRHVFVLCFFFFFNILFGEGTLQ